MSTPWEVVAGYLRAYRGFVSAEVTVADFVEEMLKFVAKWEKTQCENHECSIPTGINRDSMAVYGECRECGCTYSARLEDIKWRL